MAGQMTRVARGSGLRQNRWWDLHFGRMMTPQSRWPLVTTSVSGIGPEIWESFRKRADATGVTYREAIEAAIHDLITDVQEDRQIIWYPPQPGGPFPFQIHEKVRE